MTRVGGSGEVTWPRASRVPGVHSRPRRGVRIHRMTQVKGSLGSVSGHQRPAESVCECSQWSSQAMFTSPDLRCTYAGAHTHTHTPTRAHAGGSQSRGLSLPPWCVVSLSTFHVSPAGNREQLV